MEREFFVHLDELDLPEVIKQYYSDKVQDFTNAQLQSMLYWDENDFLTHYELEDEVGGINYQTFVQSLKAVVEYMMDDEETHYQECLGDGDAKNHIYLHVYNLNEWLKKYSGA